MRPVPQQAVELVKRWEGCKLKSYQDSVGVWTIGYGHTGSVRPGQLINQSQATKFLIADLGVASTRLASRIGPVVDELTDNQYAALLSFVFNLGANPKWTIWKRLKARQFEAVPGEMLRFVYAGGKRLQGLVNRRNAEVALWRTGEPGTDDANPPSSVTRLAATPPTPVPTKAGGLVAGIAAAVTAGPALVTQAVQAIQPFAFSPMVMQAMGVLGAIGAALVVLKLVLDWMQKREAKR